MMQRIAGAVAVCVQLHKETVTDRGPQHHTTKGILRRTFTIERCCGDAHRSTLFFDVVRTNPTTLGEQLAEKATRAAWNRLMEIFRGMTRDLNADWVSNNPRFDIPLALENVYGFLKDTGDVVDLQAPDVPDAA